MMTTDSLAVEGLDPEIIGIEVTLVSKEAQFFVEQHIQSPPNGYYECPYCSALYMSYMWSVI